MCNYDKLHDTITRAVLLIVHAAPYLGRGGYELNPLPEVLTRSFGNVKNYAVSDNNTAEVSVEAILST